jgi:hypothetical protein
MFNEKNALCAKYCLVNKRMFTYRHIQILHGFVSYLLFRMCLPVTCSHEVYESNDKFLGKFQRVKISQNGYKFFSGDQPHQCSVKNQRFGD